MINTLPNYLGCKTMKNQKNRDQYFRKRLMALTAVFLLIVSVAVAQAQTEPFDRVSFAEPRMPARFEQGVILATFISQSTKESET